MLSENDKNVQIISTEKLMKETSIFKQWSGPILIKILDGITENITSLGSGGLIKYKNRFFAITNEHVVAGIDYLSRIDSLNIPYIDTNNIGRRMKLIGQARDSGDDIAAFEICESTVKKISDHTFLEQEFIEYDLKYYLETSNIVFLHGYPYFDTKIDHEHKIVDMVTLPYTTFIESYDDFSEILMLHCDLSGISEFGEDIQVTTFGGMSGSFVYGFFMDGETTMYKCLGLLSFWEHKNNKLGVFPIQDVLKFLDKNFFEN